jgi:tripartite-type tricarboxylate transporter receptor subunit TctC
MKIGLRWLKLTLLWLVTISAAGSAFGQSPSYPNKPVRLISDSSPGSAVDVGLRIIADGMSKHWNQQIVVVNQAGAAGAISARAAAQAEPDGYTLYAPALSVFLAVPGKASNLPLMIPRDFAAVGYTVDQPLAIGVSPKLGVKTLQDLIDLAKKQPGKLSYAVTGIGRLTHLMGELLQLRTGIELQMVPYSGGSAQAFTDVIAGRIPIVMEGYSGLVGSFDAGTIQPLAVASPKRLPSAPNLPTVGETLPGFVASGWQAVLAPNGTPEALINEASKCLRIALDSAAVKDALANRGSFARPMSPSEVTAFIRAQQEQWKPAIERIAALTK